MAELFLKLFNMSVSAGWLILAVILLRWVFRKMPKWMNCVLWAAVAFRLVCPFTIESALSLIPSAQPLPQRVITGPSFRVDTGVEIVDRPVNEYLGDHYFEGVSTAAGTGGSVMTVWAAVWIIGVLAMAGYGAASYYRIYRLVRASLETEEGVWLCDAIQTPFILGMLRPRIYLPSTLGKNQAEHVIAHENAHLKRRDHWWKPLGFALLALHWFNPLCWAAYMLFCRDIELACDERVIRDMDLESRKAYSKALLSCSMPNKMIAACPLAFGEVGVRERVKSVLDYKKPAFWVVLAAVVTCIAVAACFLTNPKEREQDADAGTEAGASGIQEDASADGEPAEEQENTEQENTGQDNTEGLIVLQEGRYYLLPITRPDIQTEYFSMRMADEMVGKASCILEVSPSGLEEVSFFMDALAEGYTPSDNAGEIFDFADSGRGWLGHIFWEDLTDYEEWGILEELIQRSATTEISRMNYCYNELFVPVGQRVVAVNEGETGAYFLRKPTDVQFSQELKEEYLACQEAFLDSVPYFASKRYPLEADYGQLCDLGRIPTIGVDDAVLVNFKTAEWAYALFRGAAELATDPEDGYEVKVDGDRTSYPYARVSCVDFFNMEEFRTYLGCYFPEKTVNRLLDTKVTDHELPLFEERDGVLYRMQGDIGTLDYDDYDAQYLITEDTDADGGRTAVISMLCSTDYPGYETVKVLEYTLTARQEYESWNPNPLTRWIVSEDFRLPIDILLDRPE